MATLRNITFDCADPSSLATFWAAVLGYGERRDAGDEVLIAEVGWPFPRLTFQRVPEPKTAKNRVHLDVTANDLDAEIARLVRLGATVAADRVESGSMAWVVLRDPEGNEFCVTHVPE